MGNPPPCPSPVRGRARIPQNACLAGARRAGMNPKGLDAHDGQEGGKGPDKGLSV